MWELITAKTKKMNTRIKKLFAGKYSLVIVALALITFAISCKKSSKNDTSTPSTPSVVGTYYGTLSIGAYTEADTIVIQSGSGSEIVMVSKTESGSGYTINGTADGNNISIPSQSVYVPALNATYTVTGSGALTNSTLVINYVFVSSTHVSTNTTFTGKKQ